MVADRRHTDDPGSMIRIDSAGRFVERAGDGTEVQLGVVRVFEPARRLVLDWYPGTDRSSATHVEILFDAVEGGTRITIRHADRFTHNAPAYARSWDAVLEAAAGRVGFDLP
jgi:uncharacterized protein YndB with AHSA1/START domain